MDTETNEQLNQCLAALASSQQHWWEALAITQTQADDLSKAIAYVMSGVIAYVLIARMLNKA